GTGRVAGQLELVAGKGSRDQFGGDFTGVLAHVLRPRPGNVGVEECRDAPRAVWQGAAPAFPSVSAPLDRRGPGTYLPAFLPGGISLSMPGYLPTSNQPTDVLMTVPGRMSPGRGLLLATVHWSVADGQVTQPFLLQMSISPLSFTDQAQRAPLAVLSMHMPTA